MGDFPIPNLSSGRLISVQTYGGAREDVAKTP
jgi:hypothetical protein